LGTKNKHKTRASQKKLKNPANRTRECVAGEKDSESGPAILLEPGKSPSQRGRGGVGER